MQKHFLSLVALIVCATFLWADGAITPSTSLATYYESINGKSGDDIRTALYGKINAHTTVSYDNLKYLFKWTDTYNNAGEIIDDIYSECDPAYTESWCSGTCGYNREHSLPKSWFDEASILYSDAFHLYPTNCYVNSYRGNLAFGECANGSKCTTNGVKAKGRRGSSTFVSDAGVSYTFSKEVYEPDDEFKGDLARSYFYMVTCYKNQRFTYADGGIDMFVYENNTANLSQYSIDLLLKWHRQDPVSERELARNEVIYGNTNINKGSYKQGNRNPFIDYPELAEYIWGTKKGQSVNVASLTSAYDGGYTPDPPTPAVKYGVTWSVNGEEQSVDSVAENQNISALPATPVSCSTESNVFMGWTTAVIEDTQDNAPAVLYTKVADFPAVTKDVTYYAVFAKEEVTEGAAPAVYTYNAGSNEGWTNTASKSNSYWLLDSGKELISPEIDLSGLSSIQANLRTYGGTQYDQFSFVAGNTQIGTIEVTGGGTLKDYEWTNTKSLSGKSKITFTCSNAESNKGIGFTSVTINATGAGVSYTRYITSCQSSQEVELLPIEGVARKFLIDGHIYIQTANGLFTIQGQRIK